MNTELKQFILQHVIEKCTKGFNDGISVKALQRFYENHTLKFVTQDDIISAIAEIYDSTSIINNFEIKSRKIFIDLN